MIQVNGKDFELYIDSNKIKNVVSELAKKVNGDYSGRDPILIGILNGSFIFLADFIRQLEFDPCISFTKLSSYSGYKSTGLVDELIGMNENLNGRDVLVIEDIVDTGNTLEKVIAVIKSKNAASIEIISLLFKSDVFKKDIEVKYYGLDIPDVFVIGYGLDYDGRGRGLKDIYKVAQP